MPLFLEALSRRSLSDVLGFPRHALILLGATVAALSLAAAPNAALAQDGPYFQLVETVPEDPGADERWTVSDGRITLGPGPGRNDYSAVMTWSAPPASFDKAGFTITLGIEGHANPNRIYMGTGIGSTDFTFDKDPAGIDVSVPDAQPGGSESRSASIDILVTPPAFASDGAIVEFRVGAYYGYGVTYRYQVSDTPVVGNDDDDGGDDGDQDGPLVVEVDCPTEIVIGQLPSLNCHLLISGFRHNTADPVEVIVPGALDFYGNHANGIQTLQLAGAEDVFNWDEPRSWGFFVFACTGPNIGANCYDSMAVPGPATIEVIVQQKGLAPVRVMLLFNVVAKGAQGTGIGPLVRIGSRAIVGTFVNIENGTPDFSPILIDWLSAQWTLDPVEGETFVRIHSVWKPDDYLHAENGELESGPIQPIWESAMWEIEQVGDGFIRLRNRWWSDQYLNVENGILESSPVDGDWESAHWWLLQ